MKNIDDIKKRITDLQKEIKKIETERKVRIGAEFIKSFDGKTEINGNDILSFFESLKGLNLFIADVKLSAISETKTSISEPKPEVKNYVSL
jgi:hypothetical protein